MVGLLFALTALASGADLDPFDPSGSLSSGTGTPATEAASFRAKGLSLGLTGAIARDLLVVQFDGRPDEVGLRTVVPLNLHGGWTFGDRARLDLHVPFYAQADVPLADRNGPAMGDVRLSGVVKLWQPSPLFALSVAPTLGIPTGSPAPLLARGIHGGLHVVMGGERDKGFGWTTNLGVTASGTDDVLGVAMGPTGDLKGGLWWRFSDAFRLGGDLSAQLGFPNSALLTNTNLTGHVFAQASLPEGLHLTGGVGGSPVAGLGAPVWRVFAGLAFTPQPRDRDRDTFMDKVDPCPDRAEDFDGFEDDDGCPEADNDGDGILDADDVCPDTPEDVDGFDDEDGCPEADNDGDGVLDADDACPDVAGLADAKGCPDTDGDGVLDDEDACPDVAGLVAFDGCPDTDSDGVPDSRDACPEEPKPEAEDPATSDGCPKKAFVSDSRVELTEKVFFQTAKAVIDADSNTLLDDVASVLTDHPEITRVEIGGHTDDVGRRGFNLDLSRRRAAAVRTALMSRGIAGDRLLAVGYGPEQPIDTNRTEQGRANNRRVEINILEIDGAVPLEPLAPADP